MGARRPILALFAIFCAGYLAYPYLTLYRLGVAMRQADTAALESMVDWYAVREGMKEDICDLVMDGPAEPRAENELPPFGASFVRGMASNAVDENFTPATLVSMSHSAGGKPRPDTRLDWAFFQNPTLFVVDVRAEGAAEPIQLEMELHRMRWEVRRVRLPKAMLEKPGPEQVVARAER
jgi:hypothetical protein